jgi:hypothetical protein
MQDVIEFDTGVTDVAKAALRILSQASSDQIVNFACSRLW